MDRDRKYKEKSPLSVSGPQAGGNKIVFRGSLEEVRKALWDFSIEINDFYAAIDLIFKKHESDRFGDFLRLYRADIKFAINSIESGAQGTLASYNHETRCFHLINNHIQKYSGAIVKDYSIDLFTGIKHELIVERLHRLHEISKKPEIVAVKYWKKNVFPITVEYKSKKYQPSDLKNNLANNGFAKIKAPSAFRPRTAIEFFDIASKSLGLGVLKDQARSRADNALRNALSNWNKYEIS